MPDCVSGSADFAEDFAAGLADAAGFAEDFAVGFAEDFAAGSAAADFAEAALAVEAVPAASSFLEEAVAV